jgi:hypothetical protein
MPRYLQKRRRGWYAVLEVPRDVRVHFDGKVRLVQSLKTDSQREAEIAVLPLVAQWKLDIEAVRTGGSKLPQLSVARALEWRNDYLENEKLRADRRLDADERDHVEFMKLTMDEVLQDEVEKVAKVDRNAAEVLR